MTKASADTLRAYPLGTSAAETDRLRHQAEELRPHALSLLQRCQLQPGAKAVDLGCGPIGILDLLSERVGRHGQVVGLDANPTHVASARQLVRERGLANVRIVEGDARSTGLPPGDFDVVLARTLLVNVVSPRDVVAEMTRLVKPGGYVAVHEPDLAVRICYPPHPAWDRLIDLFHTGFEQDGADLCIGRKLPSLLREAELEDVGVEARADIYPLDHSRRTLLPDLVRAVRPRIVGSLLSAQELDELDRAVRAHLRNEHTLVLPGLNFLAWGRKRSGTVASDGLEPGDATQDPTTS
ncbi:MAG: methyltransferase domain-containing protein [Chloroflexi bacterium]|nr:methyltransferase domain-containing protein [Chloroflexota bacterium]